MLTDLLLSAIDPVSTLYSVASCNALATGMAARCEGHGKAVYRCNFVTAMVYAMIGVSLAVSAGH